MAKCKALTGSAVKGLITSFVSGVCGLMNLGEISAPNVPERQCTGGGRIRWYSDCTRTDICNCNRPTDVCIFRTFMCEIAGEMRLFGEIGGATLEGAGSGRSLSLIHI